MMDEQLSLGFSGAVDPPKRKRGRPRKQVVDTTVVSVPSADPSDEVPIEETPVVDEYWEGTDCLTNWPVRASYRQVQALSRTRYVHDIHVENPQVIAESHMAILQDHRHVVLRINPEQFEQIRSHPHFVGRPILYSYIDLDAQPRARQYMIFHDGFPTQEELSADDETWDVYYGLKKASKHKKQDEVREVDEKED